MGIELIANHALGDLQALESIRDDHDALVVAAGPGIRPLLDAAGIATAESGQVAGTPGRSHGSPAPVFAAGSLLKPDCSFVQALAQGKAAAARAAESLGCRIAIDPKRRFHSHIGRLLEGEILAFLEGAADTPRIEAGPGGYSREQAEAEARRCLQCDCAAKEDCLLRSHAEAYSVRRRHFRVAARRPYRCIRQHPDVDFEPGKCIKCGICVRLSERSATPENADSGLAFLKRGYDLEVGTPFHESLSRALEYSAERCVASCPTGALAIRRRPRMEA
jgi:ferredoxin